MTALRARARSLVAAVLACVRRPSGNHRADPGGPVPPPEPPEWARSIPPQSAATVQLRVADLVRPYSLVPKPREGGRHRAG